MTDGTVACRIVRKELAQRFEVDEMICYDKLWKRLIDESLTRTEFSRKIGISSATLAKMGKNEPIHLKYIERICAEFDCDVGDILEYRA